MSVSAAPTPPATRRRNGRPPAPGTEPRILDTALAMLAESGYAALRLDELARRAGVAKTTVLRRWPSKPAVAAAAVERLALHTVDVPEASTLGDDLRALLNNAVTVFSQGEGRFVPRLMREAGHHPEIADLLRTVIHTRRMGYRRALGRAIARGELDPEIDQELLIDLLIGPTGHDCSSPMIPSPCRSSTTSSEPSCVRTHRSRPRSLERPPSHAREIALRGTRL